MDGLIKNYSYNYDIMKLAIQAIKSPNVLAKPINTILIELIGSRFSAKTIQTLRAWTIEFPIMCEQEGINLGVNVIRLEPSGASETYDEMLAVAEDLYEIDITRKNANQTKKRFQVGTANIRSLGVMSNRKRKTPKLGLARKGVKKDIEINIFEEATEFEDEKQISIINQATGGAKLNIRVFMANPWIITNWYVNKIAKFCPFNEKTLRTKGEIFKQQYEPIVIHMEKQEDGTSKPVKKKLTKTLRIAHITNHRINTYLSEAQHQELTNLWSIDETLARVADLGMPGMSEGLIYANVIDKIRTPLKNMKTQEFRGGIDFGNSTGTKGSATTLLCGRIGYQYSFLAFDKEYYHSNANSYYKNDDELVQDLVETAIQYVKEWKDEILKTDNKKLTLYFDWATFLLEKAIKTELAIRSQEEYQYVRLIQVKPCYKYEVPVRIRSMVMLMAQGRYYVNREQCPYHILELQNAMWDPTREVKGQNTRLNENDHTLDASEYMPSADLNKFVGETAIKYSNVLRRLG